MSTGSESAWGSAWNNYVHLQGGRIEVVEDPTYGKVLRHTITDNTVLEDGKRKVRVYLTAGWGRPEAGSCSVKIPIRLSTAYRPARVYDDGTAAEDGGWANLLSVFSTTPQTDRDYNILGNIDIWPNMVPVINAKKPYSGESYAFYEGKTVLKANKWYELELHVDKNGIVHLMVNGIEEASGPLAPENRKLQVEFVHGGAYGTGLPNGAYIDNGPIEVICW